MLKIKPEDIEKRIRSKTALIEFFQQKRKLHFPKESCFNTKFLLQVFSKEKLLLPISSKSAPYLGRIKKYQSFDKPNLLCIIQGNEIMKKYIPDNIDASRVERDTLLSVRYSLNFRLYTMLIL